MNRLQKASTSRGPRAMIALLFALILSTTACNRAANTLMGQETASGGMATTLNISNSRLQKKIAIDVNAKSRRPNGNLEVSVQLTNQTKKSRKFEYKFLWLDPDGFEVSRSRGTWTPMVIDGQESMGVQGTASTPAADSFKLLIRFPQPITE